MTVVSPAVDPNSTTVQVWVQARNPRQPLEARLHGHGDGLTKKVPNALVIPRSALQSDPGISAPT